MLQSKGPATPPGTIVTGWLVDAAQTSLFASEDYARLFASADATVFQSPVWLSALYQHLAPRAKAKPLIIQIRHPVTKQLVAVLPFEVRRYGFMRVAAFADFGVSDYCVPPVDPDYRDALLGDPSLPQKIRAAMKGVSIIYINKVRANHADLFALLGELNRVDGGLSAHATKLNTSYQHWLTHTMNQAQRRSLDRKRRKLGSKGSLRLQIAEEGAAVAQMLGEIRSFREQRLKLSPSWDLLKDSDYAAFYAQIAHDYDQVRTYTLYFNDEPISIAFGVARSGVFHTLLTGFSASRRNYSVGLLILQDAIRDCFARGDICFDLTIGDQPYKGVFGTSATPMVSLYQGGDLMGRLAVNLMQRSPRVLGLVRRIRRRRAEPAE